MVPMTGSTANTGDLGLFDTTFSTGATVLSALALLIGIGFMVMGYQDMALPVVGTELSILTGMVGLLFGLFIAIVAFVAAVYMEPGFDDEH
ncbi:MULTISPECIES: hypothetical protein [Natrialbaceae]|uniref:hypothetical protein n=1 Tax=Natrialbaceae TaxID=1644061 RepID=UPI00207CAA55|nr:hypothetical protein [Natronococcus sp. CG52]